MPSKTRDKFGDDHDVQSAAAGLAPERHEPTGVPNLDYVLGGGLPHGALVLVMGLPGSGKTTLASQIVFHAAAAGKVVLILTALSESTSNLIGHLASFRFFDRTLIGGPVQFLSLQQVLPQGLPATAAAIFAEARRIKADFMLLDGFRGLPSAGTEAQAAREFLFEVGTTLNTLGITSIITSEADPRDPAFYPAATTADVILGLHYTLLGVRQYRGIEVVKARGRAPVPGLHAFVLGADGATVYPQLEERVTAEHLEAVRQAPAVEASRAAAAPVERVAFDLPAFDAMLGGGIPRATCTLLAGSLGTGKTLLALHYTLAGTRAGEPVVYLGFRESRAQLRQVAQSFALGADLARALETDGHLTFLEVPPIKVNADILADRLLTELDRRGAQRLVIDSVAELERAVLRSADPQRLEDYVAALLQALRSRNVTALLIKETDKVVAATLELSADALSVLAENVLLLQRVPYRGHMHRILSVLKLRFSDHDSAFREFRIHAPEGLQVLEPFVSDEGVLEGIAHGQEQQALDESDHRAGGLRARGQQEKP
ncbi:MAG TPA: ATPase domain-containing protein [Ktedonobacterales bacterium]|nr:ATPase domain-containing protein [Ktedonobacterales bacterium]